MTIRLGQRTLEGGDLYPWIRATLAGDVGIAVHPVPREDASQLDRGGG